MKDYIEELYDLREDLKSLLRKDFLTELVALAELIDRSYVDSYKRLKENSEHGSNCGYAVKAKDLFCKFQEIGISKKIAYIYKTFIEEKN